MPGHLPMPGKGESSMYTMPHGCVATVSHVVFQVPMLAACRSGPPAVPYRSRGVEGFTKNPSILDRYLWMGGWSKAVGGISPAP